MVWVQLTSYFLSLLCELMSQAGQLGYSITSPPLWMVQEWAMRFNPGAHIRTTGKDKFFLLSFLLKLWAWSCQWPPCGKSTPKNGANTEEGQAKNGREKRKRPDGILWAPGSDCTPTSLNLGIHKAIIPYMRMSVWFFFNQSNPNTVFFIYIFT